MARLIVLCVFLIQGFLCQGQSRSALRPDFAVLQYAGSIGFLSAGLGYEIFNQRARISAHFGHVPKRHGGTLNVVTGKIFFKPVEIKLRNNWHLQPIDPGLMVSYHYGENFQTKWPDQIYPDGYYWWHPALRIHLGVETSATKTFTKINAIRAVTLYAELNTNELYFISFFQNFESVRPWKIIKGGLGVRIFLD